MNPLYEIYNCIENLAVLCKVMAESLEEGENERFSVSDFSGCLYHLYDSLDQILDRMDLLFEES